MTPPKIEAGFVRMPEDEFEAMLASTVPRPPSTSTTCARCSIACAWRGALPGKPSCA